MTKEELIAAQQSLGFNHAEMATALNVPYRTYYKWVTGEREAPAIAETAISLLMFVASKNLMGEWQESNG
ncbi:hypothetical protein [Pectobacterium carotovorum]|uniref:hypothetical protein n=1 Tax=Pectobacterium carotovorum TaxID=554 RepID=UPI0021F276E2|nr:hypothetical protein [Pectobacterium carotovorum]